MGEVLSVIAGEVKSRTKITDVQMRVILCFNRIWLQVTPNLAQNWRRDELKDLTYFIPKEKTPPAFVERPIENFGEN